MKINDKETLSVAEAVKAVLEGKKIKTETEVQKANKDFVDLHAIDKKKDPEKEKQVEEKDDDVEEGNAFGQAVVNAKKAGKKKFTFKGKEYKVESTDLEEAKSVKVTTRTGSDKYDYDELLPEVQKIVIMSKHVQKNKRMDVAKKITKAIIDGKIKNADISSDLATLIGVDQPYPGAAPRGVVKDRMKELKLESTDLDENYEQAARLRVAISNTKRSIKAKENTLQAFKKQLAKGKPEYKKRVADVEDKIEDLMHTLKGQEKRLKSIKSSKNESTELEEANTDKYMWKDINMALMSAGIGTANIRKVISALKNKAIKESTNLEEAKGFDESSQGAKQTYDAVVKLSASLRKGSNLNKAVNKALGGKYDSDFVKMEKAITIIFDILDEIDRDYRDRD